VAARAEEYHQGLRRLPFVESTSYHDGLLQVALKREGSLGQLIEQFDLQDLKKIISRQPSLEDVFLKLTGRGLRH